MLAQGLYAQRNKNDEGFWILKKKNAILISSIQGQYEIDMQIITERYVKKCSQVYYTRTIKCAKRFR